MSVVSIASAHIPIFSAKLQTHKMLSDVDGFSDNLNQLVRLVLQNQLDSLELTLLEKLIVAHKITGEGLCIEQRLLFATLQAGNSEALLALIQSKRIDVNAPYKGFTPLAAVCAVEQVDMAAILLQNGAHLEQVNEKGETALHIAISYEQFGCVKLLLEEPYRANIEAKTKSGLTPLHLACEAGDLRIFEFLLLSGADFTAVCDNAVGNHCLFILVLYGREQFIRVLFTQSYKQLRIPTFVNFLSPFVSTQLASLPRPKAIYSPAHSVQKVHEDVHMSEVNSVESNHLSHAEKIARLIATPNLVGIYPLNAAASKGNAAICRLLLNYGADVGVVTKDGRLFTPLMAASYYKHHQVVNLLIQHKTATSPATLKDFLNATDSGKVSAVSTACLMNAHLVLPLLLSAGGTPDHLDLWNAALNGFVEITRQLVRTGPVDLLAQVDGMNVLQVATSNNHIPVLVELIGFQRYTNPQELGSFLDHVGGKGSALSIAVGCGHFDAACLLISAGATISVADVRLAIHHNDAKMAIYLLQQIPENMYSLNSEEDTFLISTVNRPHSSNVEILQFLLREDGPYRNQIEIPDKFGFRPLHYLVDKGDVQGTQLLLAAGADVTTCVAPQLNFTSLHLAGSKNNKGLLEVLLCHARTKAPQQFQSFIDKGNLNGDSALDIAINAGHIESVRVLLSFGAKFNHVTIHLACWNGFDEIAGLFLESIRKMGIEEKLRLVSQTRQTLSSVIENSDRMIAMDDATFAQLSDLDKFLVTFYRRNAGDLEAMCGKMERTSKLLLEDLHEQPFYDSLRAKIKQVDKEVSPEESKRKS